MVIVTCELSCSISRCSPSADSQQYVDEVVEYMRRVCAGARVYIDSYHESSPYEYRPYEDKVVNVTFDVRSSSARHAEAEDAIVRSFAGQDPPAERYYWFSIAPEASLYDEYHGIFFLDLEITDFLIGFMSNPRDFHIQYQYADTIGSLSGTLPQASFEIDRQKIMVDFMVSQGRRFTKVPSGSIAPTTELYRLEMNFKDLSPHILMGRKNDCVTMCFLTMNPLQLWRTQYDVTDIGIKHYDKTMWVRTCSVKSASPESNRLALDKTILGRSNSFVLTFPMNRVRGNEQLQNLIDSLRDYGGFNIFHTVIRYVSPTTPSVAPNVTLGGSAGDLINWLLAAIHSIGYRISHQFINDGGERFMCLVRKFAAGSRGDRRHLENALSRTYDVVSADTDRFLEIDRVLQHMLSARPELDELILTNNRMVKRAIITPSRVVFMAPCLMHDNRILREFDVDSAVSCSFQNDDMTDFGGVASSIDFVKEAIGDVLLAGIKVANRHYEFLGCSGSQLRENGCWMYARDADGNTASDIRDWMGDLEHIRNPGTYLSRMGQCFSDTTAVEMDEDIEIEWNDEDVEGGIDPRGEPYCFSDGVGRISMDCLNHVSLFRLNLSSSSCSPLYNQFFSPNPQKIGNGTFEYI